MMASTHPFEYWPPKSTVIRCSLYLGVHNSGDNCFHVSFVPVKPFFYLFACFIDIYACLYLCLFVSMLVCFLSRSTTVGTWANVTESSASFPQITYKSTNHNKLVRLFLFTNICSFIVTVLANCCLKIIEVVFGNETVKPRIVMCVMPILCLAELN